MGETARVRGTRPSLRPRRELEGPKERKLFCSRCHLWAKREDIHEGWDIAIEAADSPCTHPPAVSGPSMRVLRWTPEIQGAEQIQDPWKSKATVTGRRSLFTPLHLTLVTMGVHLRHWLHEL